MSDLARSIWLWVDTAFRTRCTGPNCGQTLWLVRSCTTGGWVPVTGRPIYIETEMRPGRRSGMRQAGRIDAGQAHMGTCVDKERFARRREDQRRRHRPGRGV